MFAACNYPCIIRINITLKLSYCINTTFKILFYGSRSIMIWHLHRIVLDVLFFRITDFKLFNSSNSNDCQNI